MAAVGVGGGQAEEAKLRGDEAAGVVELAHPERGPEALQRRGAADEAGEFFVVLVSEPPEACGPVPAGASALGRRGGPAGKVGQLLEPAAGGAGAAPLLDEAVHPVRELLVEALLGGARQRDEEQVVPRVALGTALVGGAEHGLRPPWRGAGPPQFMG